MTQPTRSRSRLLVIVLLQIVLIPTFFVIADLMVGFARDYDRGQAHVRLSQFVESMQSGVPSPARNKGLAKIEKADLRLHPYTGFGPPGLIASHSEETRLAARKAPEGEYRVMILGGSVAAGFGNPNSAGIRELKRLLELDPRFEGRTVRFIPQGFGAYKQPQQLILANYLLGSGVDPHAIISLDGFNEVALAMQNSEAGMNPGYPSFSQWVHLTTTWGSEADAVLDALNEINNSREYCVEQAIIAKRYYLLSSSLLGPRVFARLQEKKRVFADASQRYADLLQRKSGFGPLAGPKFSPKDERVIDSALKMWVESTRSLEAICAKRGIFFLNVLQPTLHDRGSKAPTEEELMTGKAHFTWVKGVALGYDKLREAGRKLREEGLHYFDGSMAFKDIEKTLYFDACHFNQSGYSILGRLMGEAFLRDLPATPLPE